ncbi:MAG: tripartite tricarboxylate transporter substrate binding protein [Rhodospirillales bacterium]
MRLVFRSKALPAALLAGLTLTFHSATVEAAWKPTKKVEISVTCKPGCGPDQIARLLQKIWKTEKITPVDTVVHNKAGGGGAVQLNYINSHPGDGHYLGIGSASSLTTYYTGRTKIGLRDVTPLVLLVTEYIVTAVKGDSPIKSAKELLAQIKKDPASLSIGTATSRGNANHQAISLAALRAGIDPKKMKFVIFQSGSIGRTNLLGGHVNVAQSSAGGFLKHHKQGKLRILAVSSPERLGGEAKDVPTWKELGYDFEVGNFRSVMGPSGMTKDQIAYWEDVFSKTVKTKEWQQFLNRRQMANAYLPHSEFLKFLDKEEKQIKEVLDALGILKVK